METLTVKGRRKSCGLKSEPHGGDFVSIHREHRGTGVRGHFKLPSFGLAHWVKPAALPPEALHGPVPAMSLTYSQDTVPTLCLRL